MSEDKSGYADADEPLTDRSCDRCTHYRSPERIDEAQDYAPSIKHICERPQLGSHRDLVIGEDVPNSRDAYRERAGGAEDRCGPEGKFWSQSGF
jgi:hypothetical protein